MKPCEPQPGNDGGPCIDTADRRCDTNTGQCTTMAVPNGGMCDASQLKLFTP